jgi:tRNA (guanine-N1)-methyltransferase
VKFTFVTLFPNIIKGYFSDSILQKAQEKKLLELEFYNPRDFTKNKHNKVDDTLCGGGAGQLMFPQPLFDALDQIREKNPDAYIVFPLAAAKPFNQNDAKRLAKKKNVVFVSGRYEGIDERVIETYANEVFSIGDYILTGGELPSMVMGDAIARNIQGVLGNNDSLDEAYAYALNYTKEHQKSFIHPYADDDVIAGQGTLALEILEELDKIDTIVIPIGGGGLIAGMASAVKQIRPEIKIVGVVASGANAMKNSFEAKQAIDSLSVKTIADGIAVRDVMPKMLDFTLELVDEIVEVEDKEIASAVLFLLERQKIIVEGAGASGLAAVMHNKVDIKGKNIVLPLSGGNIDVTMLAVIIEKGLIKSSRKMNMIITLIDKPGALMKLTEIFNENGANIVQIDYDRTSVQLDFGDANVTMALETKGYDHQEKIRRF